MKRLQAKGNSFVTCFLAGLSVLGRLPRSFWLVVAMVLTVESSLAQEALRNLRTSEAAASAFRQRQMRTQAYTFKAGDFRLLMAPSVGLDWNDNINTSKNDPQQEFILRPMLQLDASYPMTAYNVLNLSIGFGYDKYIQHDELSTWRVQSQTGTGLSLDIQVKDVSINLHDRVEYVRDTAQQSAVAGTAEYSTLNNTAGLIVTWDLQDVILNVGYDHANVFSPTQEFQSQDQATELLMGQVGLRVHPSLTAGVEATASFTAYDQMILNDNSSYTLGLYADWRPGSYIHIQPRVGYTLYKFQQTSLTNRTSDLNSWYIDLTVSHNFSEAASYSFSAGHEIRLGIESDVNEVWYFKPSINWRIIKNLSLTTFLSYEHGKQGVGNEVGNLTETYDWFVGGIALNRPLTDRLTLGLTYRLTLRSSNTPSREYAQNLVGLQLTYQLQ